MYPFKVERQDWIRLFAATLAVGTGLYLLDSWLTNTVRPGIAKFDRAYDSFLRNVSLEKAKDAVLDSIRQSSGLHRPEFSYKWEVVPLPRDRYRMSSMECSLESGERICRSFVAVVDTGAKKRIEEIRFH